MKRPARSAIRLKPAVCGVLALLLAAAALLGRAADLGVTQAILAAVENRFGAPSRKRLQEWERLVDANRGKSEMEKVRIVNDFFNNSIIFVDDINLWKVKDYWATPIEFLARGAGDCEDYSIAKYYTLRAMGVPEDKLRITYVKARLSYGEQAHMVLTYSPEARRPPLVLDNLNFDILPATQRHDLKPVYNFNGAGLWLASSGGSGKRVGGAGRLSMWNDLQSRLQAGAWGG